MDILLLVLASLGAVGGVVLLIGLLISVVKKLWFFNRVYVPLGSKEWQNYWCDNLTQIDTPIIPMWRWEAERLGIKQADCCNNGFRRSK